MVAELLLSDFGLILPNLKRIFGLSPQAPPHGGPIGASIHMRRADSGPKHAS